MTSALPIVVRELKLAARRRSTYWIRCCSAALVGGVGCAVILSSRNEPAHQVSQVIFMFSKVLCFVYSVFVGVRFTADALSQERREGTLGLLFLTDLRGYDVVMGKMVITSLNAFFGLLAALPLLAVPVLMGGVAMGEFWRTTLVLINTLLFSLGVGLLVSAFGREERSVMLATLLLLILVTFGLPISWSFIRKLWNPNWLECLLLFPSPAHLLNIAASGLYVAVPSSFWPCMGTLAGLTILCMSVASIYLPRSFREGGGESVLKSLDPASDSSRAGPGPIEHWAQLRFVPPYFWRLTRGRSLLGMPLLLAVAAGVIAIYTLATIPMSGRGGPPGEVVYFWFAVHWLFKFLVALESARPFSEDRQCRALELLLASPLRPGQMIQAQNRRARRLFGLPLGVICVANLLISANVDDRVLSAMFFMGGVMLPVDCWALHWCAMHFSMSTSTFTRAVMASLWRVLIPVDIAFFVCVSAMASVNASQTTFSTVYIFWAIGAIAYDCMLIAAKRHTLLTRFRRLAAGDMSPRPVLSDLPAMPSGPELKQAVG